MLLLSLFYIIYTLGNMEKAIYTSDDILKKKFNAENNGYSPVEVDKFLDDIICDYELFAKTLENLNEIKEKNELKIASLSKKTEKLDIDFSLFKNKFKYIKEEDAIDNKNSFELLKRVNILEEFISSKGFDPKKIK